MAIKVIDDPILQGDIQTYSKTVETEAVKKGMLLMKSSSGKVKPATAAAIVCGIALEDAAIGEKVTYGMPMNGVVRVICAESQTIVEGDTIVAATSTISGVTYNGQAGKMTDVTFTAGGATGPEVAALVTQIRSVVGHAIEDVSTNADETKILHIRMNGRAL